MFESYYFGVIGPGFLNQVPTLANPKRSFISDDRFLRVDATPNTPNLEPTKP